DQTAAAELAGEDRVPAVDREIGVVDAVTIGGRQDLLQYHFLPLAEIQPLQPLGDHDRGTAVGCKIEVVWIGDPDRRARPGGVRVDRGQAALCPAQTVVVYPQ